jgi:CheY-specific phosphatase CheX
MAVKFTESLPEFLSESALSAFGFASPTEAIGVAADAVNGPEALAAVIGLFSDELRVTVIVIAEPPFLRRTHPMREAVPQLDDRLMRDWIGELANTVAGYLKACIYGQGVTMRITPPSVDLAGETLGAYGQTRRLHHVDLACGADRVRCTLAVKD